MKLTIRAITLLAVLGIFSSIAYAMPIRDTLMQDFFIGVDNNGNLNDHSNGTVTVKGIKFPKSGIIINRISATNVSNLSGKRAVFRNAGIIPIFDPMGSCDTKLSTRNHFVYPKGRARKMNLVKMRGTSVHNPKNTPGPV